MIRMKSKIEGRQSLDGWHDDDGTVAVKSRLKKSESE